MAKKRVMVFDRGGELVVEPPVAELTGGDVMRIVNNTDDDLVWIVSDTTIFTGGAPVLETIAARKLSSPKTAVNTPNFAATAAYQLISIKSGRKGKGNSDPVIIVEN